jgi:hypothetical protein
MDRYIRLLSILVHCPDGVPFSALQAQGFEWGEANGLLVTGDASLYEGRFRITRDGQRLIDASSQGTPLRLPRTA